MTVLRRATKWLTRRWKWGLVPYRGGRERPELMLRVVAAGGHVDGLVNNAGIIRDSSFAKMTQQQWDDVYKVHLEGTMR